MSKVKTIIVIFEMYERVRIRANDVRGKINGIWLSVSGISYNVEWVNPESTNIYTKWFVAEELDSL